jgi:hypothetical protein
VSPRRRSDAPPFRFEWERVIRAVVLPATVKHVALNLATYADADGTRVFPGNEAIASDTGLSDKTVRRALERLRDVGLIVRVVSGQRMGRRGVADGYELAIPADLLERVLLVSQQGRTPVTVTGDSDGTPVTVTADPEPNTGHTFPEHRSDVPQPPVTRSGNTGHCDRSPVHDHHMYQPIDHPSASVLDVSTDRATAETRYRP